MLVWGKPRPIIKCDICGKRFCPEDEDCDCYPNLTDEENRELAKWRRECELEDDDVTN